VGSGKLNPEDGMRTLTIAVAVAAVSIIGVADAYAQKGKKAHAFCGPNGMQVCMDRCNKAGGQSRGCPQWCSRQQVDLCK
jgi:hypothetical protein